MPKKSAGILLYRFTNSEPEFLLVHPGGPLHVKRDLGAWSIPKGEYDDGEDPLTVAKREFYEETGQYVPANDFFELNPIKQKSGKLVHAWAAEGDLDIASITSNTFRLEWPPRSGKWIDTPEVDRAEWFSFDTALDKINPAQAALVRELFEKLTT
jgi:predicted NUDIX family NTP pyrophosphohydrolase